MAKKKTPKIEYEVENACDVPVDSVFVLNGHGTPELMEVDDDAGDD